MPWATSGVTSYAESRIVVLGIVGCYPDRRNIVRQTEGSQGVETPSLYCCRTTCSTFLPWSVKAKVW